MMESPIEYVEQLITYSIEEDLEDYFRVRYFNTPFYVIKKGDNDHIVLTAIKFSRSRKINSEEYSEIGKFNNPFYNEDWVSFFELNSLLADKSILYIRNVEVKIHELSMDCSIRVASECFINHSLILEEVECQ